MEAMKLWRAAYKICPQLEEPTWNSNGEHASQEGHASHIDSRDGFAWHHTILSRQLLMLVDGGKSWSQM
jgi:hypothetical protein